MSRHRVYRTTKYYGANSSALKTRRCCSECGTLYELRNMFYDMNGELVCKNCSHAGFTVADIIEYFSKFSPDTFVKLFFDDLQSRRQTECFLDFSDKGLIKTFGTVNIHVKRRTAKSDNPYYLFGENIGGKPALDVYEGQDDRAGEDDADEESEIPP